MSELARRSKVRSGLERLHGVKLIEENNNGATCYFGGTWKLQPRFWEQQTEDFSFSLHRAMHFVLRTSPGREHPTYLFEGSLRLAPRCWVNVCVTKWLEVIGDPRPAPFFNRAPGATAFRSHVSVERINYSNYSRIGVEGLEINDLEQIAAVIEAPMQDFLARVVTEDAASRRSHVDGRIHWNWREPKAEIVALHDIFARFVQEFVPVKTDGPLLNRYKAEPLTPHWRAVLHVEDEPDVQINIPHVDRDAYDTFNPIVKIAGLDIPFELYSITRIDPVEHGLACFVEPKRRIDLFLLVHPFSPLIRTFRKPPDGLSPELVDRAANHLRSAWLKVHARPEGSAFPAVLII